MTTEDTLYLRREHKYEDCTVAFHFEPASGALQLSDYDRRIIVSKLVGQLAAWHKAYTGPRDRIGSDLSHNTQDAASGVYGTLQRVDPGAARTFFDRYGAPRSWVRGPVVDCQGYLCAGIYQKRVEPAVSPPAYRTPGTGPAPLTEHERLTTQEVASHLRALRLILGHEVAIETQGDDGRVARFTSSDYDWKNLEGEPASV